MKSVLIPIQPKWCELIASGKKTIEVRKTAPKDKEPFKVYIYQTKKKWIYKLLEKLGLYQGKVIGEFACNNVQDFKVASYGNYYPLDKELQAMCLTVMELLDYGKKKPLYGWHISDLKIYDKPKELGEFKKPCDRFLDCMVCRRHIRDEYGSCESKITRPPQSWCYVEAV